MITLIKINFTANGRYAKTISIMTDTMYYT